MAATHVQAYRAINNVRVVAGVDLEEEKLDAFCNQHNIEHRFSSLDAALAWGEFDAVSNVTPDNVHHRSTLPLIAAGKHVLCEKPLAENYNDALEMAQKASEAGIVNCVNLSYRDGPAMQHAAELIASGAIGAVRHFEASYLQSWLTQPAWGDWKTESRWLWRLSKKHGSHGVVGDVGVHILDYTCFVLGSLPISLSSSMKTFNKAPNNVIGEFDLDANDSFVMHTQLANGALGTISASRFATGHLNDLRLRVYGTKGGMEVLFENGESRLNACIGANTETVHWEAIPCPPVATIYERFVSAIQSNTDATPNFSRGADLQKLIDKILAG